MIESPPIAPDQTVSPDPETNAERTPWRRYGAVAGLIAGGVAVGIGMFVASLLDVASPIDAVGSEFIDQVPLWLKQLAIEWFGTNDKLALRVGIVVTLAVAALAVGVVTVRRRAIGFAGIAAFGVIGGAAALHRPGASWTAVLPPLIGSIAGIAVLARMAPVPLAPIEMPGPSRAPLGWDRRRFLVTGGTATAVAVVAGGLARSSERSRVATIREAIPDGLPPVTGPSVQIPAGADVNPATPFVTPNADFYRIDTALSFPRISLARWKLDLDGMVDSPLSLSYDDLRQRPQIERVITLACVSNEVGGPYISNAVFQGVLLADLLAEAGVQSGAEQVFSTSLDGWTCGFPVAAALDGRDAMIALGMNGEALPLEHGFPARLVVPGLYGYVSATKWLKHIELTTWDGAKGYWVPRGWAREAPIKTQSRIDVPRSGDEVAAGPARAAGVAWAQHRGVAKVEVRVDDGEWQEARLGDDVSDDAWRQWVIDWTATPGTHTLQVRATDRTGATQTADIARPDPDGATGYHSRQIKVV